MLINSEHSYSLLCLGLLFIFNDPNLNGRQNMGF